MFPDPGNLRPERIRQKLDSGRTPVQIAFWFMSSAVTQELNSKISNSLESFVLRLQESLIIDPKEKSDLMVHILNNESIAVVDKLCGYLHDKCDNDINEFIGVLEQTPLLPPLAQHMRRVVARCEEVSRNTDRAQEEGRSNGSTVL